jgi:hypothetical protein
MQKSFSECRSMVGHQPHVRLSHNQALSVGQFSVQTNYESFYITQNQSYDGGAGNLDPIRLVHRAIECN